MKTTGLKILFIALLSMTVANSEMIRIDTKEVVVDTNKRLMWQDDENTQGKKWQWHQAKWYCDNLVFAGFDDWYLPDLNELKSTIGFSKATVNNADRTISPAFKRRPYDFSNWYWSTTPSSEYPNSQKMYIAYYTPKPDIDDYVMNGYTGARCVRQMQSNESVDKDTINESNRQETLKKEREAQLKKEQDEKAAKEAARKFVKLGNCEVGETVYHREAWDTSTSSGNFLADALFNASVKESFIIEFEGVVKGFVGKKVEVYLQDYSVKQTRGGGFLQPATGVGNSVSNYADKRIGKSHFFDKSRCGN